MGRVRCKHLAATQPFLKGIYKASIKGLGFRVSLEFPKIKGYLILGSVNIGSYHLGCCFRVPYFRKLPNRVPVEGFPGFVAFGVCGSGVRGLWL